MKDIKTMSIVIFEIKKVSVGRMVGGSIEEIKGEKSRKIKSQASQANKNIRDQGRLQNLQNLCEGYSYDSLLDESEVDSIFSSEQSKEQRESHSRDAGEEDSSPSLSDSMSKTEKHSISSGSFIAPEDDGYYLNERYKSKSKAKSGSRKERKTK